MTKNENDNPPGDIVYKDGDLIPELHPLFTPAMSTKTIDLALKQLDEYQRVGGHYGSKT